MNNIQSLPIDEDKATFLKERKNFSKKVHNFAELFKIDDMYVSQLFAEEQSKVLDVYCEILPNNMSLDNPVIDILIWENVKLKLKLEASNALALTDPLTGLGNRHVFNDELNRKVKRYSRSIFPDPKNSGPDNFSLILFDLDNFKSINDTFGHLVGDKILKKVASVALEHTRSNDLLVRYGGEEFSILVDGDVDMAYTLAERIREGIKEINVDAFGIDSNIREKVTASFGVSQYTWLGDQDQEQSIEMLINGTDILLYEAKTSGRNMTVKSGYFY